jgi:alpha/beta superfamily hydrolase
MRIRIRRPREVLLASRLRSVLFRGPAGELEGLWKEAPAARRGAAVFAHPHPLHGGTMHNKVVYRAVQELTRAGFATLRFQFRGVGLSAGRYDAGRGEVDDVRAAFDEAQSRAGLPLLAGGFSFGAAMALRAADGDPRVSAFLGLGLPVATESGRPLPRPSVPALFVVGERDAFGPPDELERFVGDAARVVVIPGADHFFAGKLEEAANAIREFLDGLAFGNGESAGRAS